MKTSYSVVPGTGFDAGVLPPGPLQPVVPETPHDLPDLYMQHLVSLHGSPELNEEESREVNLLIGQRMGLNERTSAIFERVRVRAREKVTAEWELAKEAVRKQQKLITEHRNQIAELTGELNRSNGKKSQAIALRDEAAQEKKQLSRFAPQREVERLNLLLLRRESEATQATQAAGEIQARINQMNLVDLKPLMEKLNELVNEEMRLAHFVTGAGFTNEFGIVVPARAPL